MAVVFDCRIPFGVRVLKEASEMVERMEVDRLVGHSVESLEEEVFSV